MALLKLREAPPVKPLSQDRPDAASLYNHLRLVEKICLVRRYQGDFLLALPGRGHSPFMLVLGVGCRRESGWNLGVA